MSGESSSRGSGVGPERDVVGRGIQEVEHDFMQTSGGLRPRTSGEHAPARSASRDPEVVWKEPVRPPAVVFEEPDPFSSQTFRASGPVRARERVSGPHAGGASAHRIGPETLLEIRERYKTGDRDGAFFLLEQFLRVYPSHEPASRLYRALRAQRKSQTASGHIDRAALLAAAAEAASPEERRELEQTLAAQKGASSAHAVEHTNLVSDVAAFVPNPFAAGGTAAIPVESVSSQILPATHIETSEPAAERAPFIPQLDLSFEEEITDAGTRLSPLLSSNNTAQGSELDRHASAHAHEHATQLGASESQDYSGRGGFGFNGTDEDSNEAVSLSSQEHVSHSHQLTLGDAMEQSPDTLDREEMEAREQEGTASNESEALPFALVPDLMSTDDMPHLAFHSDSESTSESEEAENSGTLSRKAAAELGSDAEGDEDEAVQSTGTGHFIEPDLDQPFGVMISDLSFEQETTNPRMQAADFTTEDGRSEPTEIAEKEENTDKFKARITAPALGIHDPISEQDDLSEFNTLRDSVIVFSSQDVHSEETTGWSVVDVIAAEQLASPEAEAVLSQVARAPEGEGAESSDENPVAPWEVEPSWEVEAKVLEAVSGSLDHRAVDTETAPLLSEERAEVDTAQATDNVELAASESPAIEHAASAAEAEFLSDSDVETVPERVEFSVSSAVMGGPSDSPVSDDVMSATEAFSEVDISPVPEDGAVDFGAAATDPVATLALKTASASEERAEQDAAATDGSGSEAMEAETGLDTGLSASDLSPDSLALNAETDGHSVSDEAEGVSAERTSTEGAERHSEFASDETFEPLGDAFVAAEGSTESAGQSSPQVIGSELLAPVAAVAALSAAAMAGSGTSEEPGLVTEQATVQATEQATSESMQETGQEFAQDTSERATESESAADAATAGSADSEVKSEGAADAIQMLELVPLEEVPAPHATGVSSSLPEVPLQREEKPARIKLTGPFEVPSSPWTRAFWDAPSTESVSLEGPKHLHTDSSARAGERVVVEKPSQRSRSEFVEALELPSAGSIGPVEQEEPVEERRDVPRTTSPLTSESVLALNLEVLMQTRYLFSVEERLLLCQVNGSRSLRELMSFRGELPQEHVTPFIKSLVEEGSIVMIESAAQS